MANNPVQGCHFTAKRSPLPVSEGEANPTSRIMIDALKGESFSYAYISPITELSLHRILQCHVYRRPSESCAASFTLLLIYRERLRVFDRD